ncbi:MAG: shikimate dehydrogenase [Clostridiales bacterium]|nr:shikimate dehydrogenase [Clostridiales bacterium]
MRRYAVIGFPVEQSRSPELYLPLFRKHGINADFVCRTVLPGDIPDIRLITEDLSGFAVTMPHKRAIIPYLDEIDDTASACGAVNIVERRGDKLIGHNTDGEGLADAILALGVSVSGMTAAMLGRGGAAVSAAYALAKRGASVTLLVRSPSESPAFPEVSPSAVLSHFDIFINASPVGMKGREDFWELTFLDIMRPKLVCDMVYRNDGDTSLISGAKARGIPAVDGHEMLKRQGLRAFGIWTGIRPE